MTVMVMVMEGRCLCRFFRPSKQASDCFCWLGFCFPCSIESGFGDDVVGEKGFWRVSDTSWKDEHDSSNSCCISWPVVNGC